MSSGEDKSVGDANEEEVPSGSFVERVRLVDHIHRHLSYSVFGLCLLAIPVGILTGYGAWGFRRVFRIAGDWLRGDMEISGGMLQMIQLSVGGLIFGLVLHFLRWERFRTPAHVIVAASENGGKLRLRDGSITAVADAIALALAAPVGRYGPAVSLGAMIGSVFAQWMKLGETSIKILLGCGVAGAISASFNAPIAGVIFAHEVIIGHFKLKAFAPITLSSVAAVALTRFHQVEYVGLKLWQAPHPVTLEDYPLYMLLGLISALVAMMYMSGIMRASWVARKARLPKWIQPMIGGAIAGVVGLWLPGALGLGDRTFLAVLEQNLDSPQFGVMALAALGLGKLIGSVCCLGLRYPGGAFTPAMFIGAMIGGVFGILVPTLDYQISVLVGMGAMVGAVVGAPLSVILIVFELTENYQAATGVMFAVVVANALVTRYFARSLFHRQIRVWGIEINRPGEQRLLSRRFLSELVRRDAATVSSGASYEESRETLDKHRGRVIFVIDSEGDLIGQLPDVNWSELNEETRMGDLAVKPKVMLCETDTQWYGFEKMEHHANQVAPVIESEDSQKLVGVITTPRLMVAYRKAIQESRRDGER